MKLDRRHQAGPDIIHSVSCTCPACHRPRPSDPPRSLLARLPHRVPALFAAGMATGAIAVAATGHLGAALRALFGL